MSSNLNHEFDIEPGATREGAAGLVRLRIDLGYDGTAFAGWAKQPAQRTVQGELETALSVVLRLESAPTLTVAGRTDAGVHARGQVVHLDVAAATLDQQSGILHEGGAVGAVVAGGTRRPTVADGLVRRLNGVLPADIEVRRLGLAPDGFDARFSALSRRYSYRVADGWLDPVRRHDTLAHPWQLDVDAMTGASFALLGEHDFAAYCRRREGATTVRALLDLSWTRDAAGVVIARVEADAFCHSMVRALVGAVLAVGDGRRSADWPASVLAGGVRHSGLTVALARGLTLEEVRYPSAADLARRAQETRRLRVRATPHAAT